MKTKLVMSLVVVAASFNMTGCKLAEMAIKHATEQKSKAPVMSVEQEKQTNEWLAGNHKLRRQYYNLSDDFYMARHEYNQVSYIFRNKAPEKQTKTPVFNECRYKADRWFREQDRILAYKIEANLIAPVDGLYDVNKLEQKYKSMVSKCPAQKYKTEQNPGYSDYIKRKAEAEKVKAKYDGVWSEMTNIRKELKQRTVVKMTTKDSYKDALEAKLNERVISDRSGELDFSTDFYYKKSHFVVYDSIPQTVK